MGIEGVGKLGMGVVEGGVQGRWLFWGCTGSVGVRVFLTHDRLIALRY